jgi:hypothetical protein
MMMNNIIQPAAPPGGPAASPHRRGIIRLNLQPSAFSLQPSLQKRRNFALPMGFNGLT